MITTIISWILASRIHISILFYFIIIGGFGDFFSDYLIFAAVFWHYAVYLFDRVYDWKIDNAYQKNEAIPSSAVSILSIFIALLLITSLYFFWKSNHPIWYWIIFLPFTFLYTVPILNRKRIKQILFFKNFYSALVIWCFPIFSVICLQEGSSGLTTTNIISLLNLLVSVLIIEAFWDIRDKEGDLEHNISTIPNRFGILKTKFYLFSLLIILFFLSQGFSFFILMMSIFILFIGEKSPKIYFHLPIFLLILRYIIHF